MDLSPEYLDPPTLAKIQALELKARRTIEGLVSGPHRSPLQGVSVEFAEHREYVPGEDVRHLDWKLFGKTDRLFVKRYEQETNLVCNLVLDASQSMAYASKDISKLKYASQIAACLAYLVVHRQDSVGAAFFETEVTQFIPAASTPQQLTQLLHLLAQVEPLPQRGKVGAALDELAERYRKRSLVIVASDCFDDVDSIMTGLKHLRHRRHEAALFHVLDPAELDFPFRDVTMFKGLEGIPPQLADPKGLRAAYQEAFGAYRQRLEIECRTAGVDYVLARTDRPLDQFLFEYLAARQ
jgi:uncharacterized protein (DUF58 family)